MQLVDQLADLRAVEYSREEVQYSTYPCITVDMTLVCTILCICNVPKNSEGTASSVRNFLVSSFSNLC